MARSAVQSRKRKARKASKAAKEAKALPYAEQRQMKGKARKMPPLLSRYVNP